MSSTSIGSISDGYDDTSHINRLPSEILADIFTSLANSAMHFSLRMSTLGKERFAKRQRLSHLLLITGVCRYWRAVALDCAELWLEPMLCRSTELADLMLARSRDAPLSVSYSSGERGDGVVRRILRQRHRLRHVRLEFRCYNETHLAQVETDFDDLIPLLASRSLEDAEQAGGYPVLETLAVRYFDFRHEFFDVDIATQRLPEGFMRGEVPCLKYLEIVGFDGVVDCAFLSEGLMGAKLTHLRLERGANDPDESSSPVRITNIKAWSIFLSFIARQVPYLESLRLEHSLPAYTSNRTPPGNEDASMHPPIVLEHLRELVMADSPASITFFCRNVHFPHVPCPQIRLYTPDSRRSECEDLWAVLPGCWSRGQMLRAIRMKEGARDGDVPEVVLIPYANAAMDSDDANDMDTSSADGLFLEIVLGVDVNVSHVLPGVLASLSQRQRLIFSLEGLLSLELTGTWTQDLTAEMWTSTVAGLPRLARISVREAVGVVPQFVHAIQGDTKIPVPFPALEEVEFYYVDLGRDGTADSDQAESTTPQMTPVEALVEAWRKPRQARGSQSPTGLSSELEVRIKRCVGFRRGDYARMIRILSEGDDDFVVDNRRGKVKVTWDGKSGKNLWRDPSSFEFWDSGSGEEA